MSEPINNLLAGSASNKSRIVNALIGERLPKEDLGILGNAFLAAGRLAEAGGVYGTPLKLYNQIIQDGRDRPITEADFPGVELDTLKRLVLEKAKNTYAPSGHFTYKDYNGNYGADDPAARNLLLTLGGFQYNIGDDGNISIFDKWDFNRDKATKWEGYEVEASPEIAAIMPTAYAASIGRTVIPDGTGVPVNITLDADRTAQPHPKDINVLDDRFLHMAPRQNIRRVTNALLSN